MLLLCQNLATMVHVLLRASCIVACIVHIVHCRQYCVTHTTYCTISCRKKQILVMILGIGVITDYL